MIRKGIARKERRNHVGLKMARSAGNKSRGTVGGYKRDYYANTSTPRPRTPSDDEMLDAEEITCENCPIESACKDFMCAPVGPMGPPDPPCTHCDTREELQEWESEYGY